MRIMNITKSRRFLDQIKQLVTTSWLNLGPWSVPVALLGIVVLSYGVFIPWFGLYGDDWIYLYAYHVGGPTFFIDFVAWDRPFSAWIYLLTTPLFGENIMLYHIFMLILRWMSAVLLWWVLRMVWKKHEWQVAGVAILFAIYPGFRQQPLPLEFILHFSSLNLFLLSVGLMLLSLSNRHRFWIYTIFSLLTSAWAMFPIEYFFGWEMLRPIFIWMMLGQNQETLTTSKKIKRTITYWLPYIAVVLIYLFWRVFIFEFPSYQPVNLQGSYLKIALAFAARIFTDLRIALLDAWGLIFQFPVMSSSNLRYYALIVLAFFLVIIYLVNLNKGKRAAESTSLNLREHWGVQAFWIGIFSLLIAGPPFWVAGVPFDLTFPWDRTSLTFMLGVCLVFVGLIEMVIHPRFRTIILSVLIALAMGSQYLNAKFYNSEWQKMNSFFWQLSWRAPALKPGTLILYDKIKLNAVSDNDLTPLLNWMYAPDRHSTQLDYKFFNLDIRYQTQYTGLDELKEGIPIDHINRSLSFVGNTSNALVVTNSSTACMRVLDTHDELLPNLSELLIDAIPISHPDQIVNVNQAVRPPFMEPELVHGWCYYFQKADLARSQQNWPRVVELSDEAFSQRLQAIDKTEYLPFIEGYARTANWDRATELSIDVGETDVAFRPALCDFWTRMQQDSSINSEAQMTIDSIKTQSGCVP